MIAAIPPIRRVSMAALIGCFFTIFPLIRPIISKDAPVRKNEIKNLFSLIKLDSGEITNDNNGIKPIIMKARKVAKATFRGCLSCVFCKSFFDFVDR